MLQMSSSTDELHAALIAFVGVRTPADVARTPAGEKERPAIVHVRPKQAPVEGPGESAALLIAGDSGVKFKTDAIDLTTGDFIFVQDMRVKKKIKMKQLAEEIDFSPEELGAGAGILRLNGKDTKDVCAAASSFVRASPNQKLSVLLALFANELVKVGSWKIIPRADREASLQLLKAGVVSVFQQPNVLGGTVVFGSGPWPAVEKGNANGESWAEVVDSMAEDLADHVARLGLNVEVLSESSAIEEQWMFRDGLHFGLHAAGAVTELFEKWARAARRKAEQGTPALTD